MPHVPSSGTSRSSHRTRRRSTHDYDAMQSGENLRDDVLQQEQVDGVVMPGSIMPGTIATASFAASIRPVAIVDTLPTLPHADYPEFSYAVLTSDERLYKNIGETWVLGVDGDDIVANSITGGKIAAAAISTTELAVGSPGGSLSNSDGRVLIDDNGITISDGALAIEDEFGSSVLSASGFSGSWSSFIGHGLYNADFDDGPLGVVGLGRTSALPYWTVSNVSGSPVMTLTDSVSNPGEHYLKTTFSAIGDEKQIVSDVVSTSLGHDMVVGVLHQTNRDGAGTLTLTIGVETSSDGSTWVDQGSNSYSLSSAGSSTADGLQHFFSASRQYARVYVKMAQTVGHDADNFIAIFTVWIKPVVEYDDVGDLMIGGDTVYPDDTVQRYAYPPGLNNTTDLSGAPLSLAINSAGLGGACMTFLTLTSVMESPEFVFYNTDASLARSAQLGLFKSGGGGGIVGALVATGTWSATPASAGVRTVAFDTPVDLAPGTYIIAIRNTSTARTCGVGGTSNGPTPFPALAASLAAASQGAWGTTEDFGTYTQTGRALGLGLVGSNW